MDEEKKEEVGSTTASMNEGVQEKTTSKSKSMLSLIIITVLIIAFVGFVFYKVFGPPLPNPAEEAQLLSTGVEAQARIVGIVEGGVFDNKYKAQNMTYKIEFTLQDGRPYTTNMTAFLKSIDLAKLVPGSIITVKYDSQNPDNVVLVQ